MRMAEGICDEKKEGSRQRISDRLAVNRKMGSETSELSACFDVQVLLNQRVLGLRNRDHS
jgi:hypothetical protein